LNDFIGYTCKKDNDRQCIDEMHNFDVDVIWPVRILFPEEIHNANLDKKPYTQN